MAAPIKSLDAFRTVNKIHAWHKIMRNLFASSRNCGLHLKYGSFVSHCAQEKMA
jgi:hypothetical protein